MTRGILALPAMTVGRQNNNPSSQNNNHSEFPLVTFTLSAHFNSKKLAPETYGVCFSFDP